MDGSPDAAEPNTALSGVGQSSARGDDVWLDCSPGQVCRNMKDVSFEGFAGADGDLGVGWRETLAREGKLTGISLGSSTRRGQ